MCNRFYQSTLLAFNLTFSLYVQYQTNHLHVNWHCMCSLFSFNSTWSTTRFMLIIMIFSRYSFCMQFQISFNAHFELMSDLSWITWRAIKKSNQSLTNLRCQSWIRLNKQSSISRTIENLRRIDMQRSRFNLSFVEILMQNSKAMSHVIHQMFQQIWFFVNDVFLWDSIDLLIACSFF